MSEEYSRYKEVKMPTLNEVQQEEMRRVMGEYPRVFKQL